MEKDEKFGRMVKVDLRKIWEDEAGDFTPWLAREENITLLGDTIGLEIEAEEEEKSVGNYQADIMARDTSNGSVVLIENQLERTDHKHLGQLMTYTAGLDAITVVWVASKFIDEHRAALDWLNENTDDKFSFFGLEVEVWKIGDSKPAPKFNIVSKPNNWSKERKVSVQKGLSDTSKFHLRYWEHFSKYMEESNTKLKAPTPSKARGRSFGIGKTNFQLTVSIRIHQNPHIRCAFRAWYASAKPMLRYLEENKPDIEKKFGQPLELSEKGVFITLSVSRDTEPKNEDEWEEQFKWFEENLVKFDSIFRPIVKDFNYEEWEDPEEGESDE